MSRCTVTFSANTGVALHLGGARLWFDALHQGKVPGFSTLSPALLRALSANPAFGDPDFIVCSHCHADHFDQALLQAAAERYPQAALLLPEPVFPRQILLEGPAPRLSRGGVTLEFAPLPHDGKQYADTPHYGCIATGDGVCVLLPGDCAVGAPELLDFVAGRPVDLALLNFPWATLPKGRAMVETLRPAHVLLGHLPFAPDDRWGYRTAAQRGAERLGAVTDVTLLLEPLQTVVYP